MDRITALERIIKKIAAPIKRQNTVAQGITTHYLTVGQGFPVVLVHGGGAGAIQWWSTLASFSEKFHVYAPDVVGYGESSKPSATYDRAYFSEWLSGFVESIGLEQFHLVAASQSGPAAIQFTVNNPQAVAKVVLVDSAGFSGRIPLGALLGLIWIYTLPTQTALSWQRRYLVQKPESLDYLLSSYAVGVARMEGGKRAFRQGRGRAVERLPATLLKSVMSPTLLVWGENDLFFPLRNARSVEKLFSRASLRVLQDAGHLCFLDQPMLFSKVVLDFLK